MPQEGNEMAQGRKGTLILTYEGFELNLLKQYCLFNSDGLVNVGAPKSNKFAMVRCEVLV